MPFPLCGSSCVHSLCIKDVVNQIVVLFVVNIGNLHFRRQCFQCGLVLCQ